MYCHVLIPTDRSELSGRAVEHGVKLARAPATLNCPIDRHRTVRLFRLESQQIENTYVKPMGHFVTEVRKCCLIYVKRSSLVQEYS